LTQCLPASIFSDHSCGAAISGCPTSIATPRRAASRWPDLGLSRISDDRDGDEFSINCRRKTHSARVAQRARHCEFICCIFHCWRTARSVCEIQRRFCPEVGTAVVDAFVIVARV
jgi:hypothetical protein